MRAAACLSTTLAVLALAAADAMAAVVEVRFDDNLRYTAAAGEANDVVVQPAPDSSPELLVVADRVAVTPGRACVLVDPLRAACVTYLREFDRFGFDLGDGDDSVLAPVVGSVRAAGGSGSDRIVTGAGDDRLDGGGGRDELRAGSGDDRLAVGDVEGSIVDADVLDGGPGRDDTVSYAGRRAGLRISLADGAPNGASGEADAVSGIENVIAGSGDDLIEGSRAANAIVGGGGNDRISGGGGSDSILEVRSGAIDCGAGDDEVRGVSVRTYLAPSCERLERRVPGVEGTDKLHVDVYPRRHGDGLALRLDCVDSPAPYGPGCRGTARIRRTGSRQLLAEGDVPAAGGKHVVRLDPTGAGRDALAGRSPVDAIVRIVGPRIGFWSWRIRLGVGSVG